MKLYKVLGLNGEAIHGGKGIWNLPKGDQPGEWMPPVEGKVQVCFNGYHLVTRSTLSHWIQQKNYLIFEAEGRGDSDFWDDKQVFREARLIKLVFDSQNTPELKKLQQEFLQENVFEPWEALTGSKLDPTMSKEAIDNLIRDLRKYSYIINSNHDLFDYLILQSDIGKRFPPTIVSRASFLLGIWIRSFDEWQMSHSEIVEIVEKFIPKEEVDAQ